MLEAAFDLDSDDGMGDVTTRLVEQSPFAERMLYLLKHSDLATTKIGIGESTSNCHGTTLYVIDEEQRILDFYNGRRGFIVGKFNYGNSVNIPLVEMNMPGYVGLINIAHFLKERGEEVDKKDAEGALVAFFFKNDGIRLAIHYGVYLGNYNGVDYMFDKKSCDGQFRVMAISKYTKKIVFDEIKRCHMPFHETEEQPRYFKFR